MKQGSESTFENRTVHQEDGKKCSQNASNLSKWEPPDGGYGWVIVGAAFMLYCVFVHFSQLGIFMLDLADKYDVSQEAMGWLHATQTVTGRLLGFLVGGLVNKLGVRWMAFAGTFFISLGYFTSAFASSFAVLYITYGILIAIGTGFLFTTPNIAVQQYFTTKRSLASAIAFSGVYGGNLFLPPLGTFLKGELGIEKTFMIESVMFLVMGIVCFILFRSPGGTGLFTTCVKKVGEKKDSTIETKSGKRSCFIDPSPLANPAFVLYLFSGFLMSVGVQTNQVYIPVRSELLNITEEKAALQLTARAAVGLVVAPLFGVLGNQPWIRRDLMFAVGMLLSGTVAMISTELTTYPLLMAYAAVFGLFSSLSMSMLHTLQVDISGISKVAASSGWFSSAFGLGHLLVHPLTGYLLDSTGSAKLPFMIAGAAMLTSGFCCCFLPLVRRAVERNRFSLGQQQPTDSTNALEIIGYEKQEENYEENDGFYNIPL